MKYYFKEIARCNMCGSSSKTHEILGRRLNKSQGKRPSRKIGLSTTICKCTDCDLIYSNPQPIPFDIQDHYGVPPEDYWQESYFVVNESYFQGEIKRLQSLIDIKPGMKSLDIGAGLGKQMKALEKIGFDTYGLEPSQPFYDRAISKMGIAKERLRLSSVEDSDYPERSFDFISFGVVLEHLYDPSMAIKKALRWLKDDGIIHIEVPSSRWLINKLIKLFYRVNLSEYVGNLSPMHEPFHLYEFDIKSFMANSRVLGYEIAHHEYYVCQTYLPKVFDTFLIPLMKKTNTGMQLCVWLKKNSI